MCEVRVSISICSKFIMVKAKAVQKEVKSRGKLYKKSQGKRFWYP